MVTKKVKLKNNEYIEAVMVEYINDYNQWTWYDVVKNSTPKKEIKKYCKEMELECGEIKEDKTDIPTNGKYPHYADGVDVRAYYIYI